MSNGVLAINMRTLRRFVQQLREVFDEAGEYRYVIFDHDSNFNQDVIAFLKATNLKPKRTGIQARPCKMELPSVWQTARDYVLPDEFMTFLQVKFGTRKWS
jgi:hypothetical protein